MENKIKNFEFNNKSLNFCNGLNVFIPASDSSILLKEISVKLESAVVYKKMFGTTACMPLERDVITITPTKILHNKKNIPIIDTIYSIWSGVPTLEMLKDIIVKPESIYIIDNIDSFLNITNLCDWLMNIVYNGHQVFISTNSHLLSQKLSLINEYPQEIDLIIGDKCEMRFFAFGNDSVIESGNLLADISYNSILEEYLKHDDLERNLFYKYNN